MYFPNDGVFSITNRMLVIRWTDSGVTKTLVFEPSDHELGENTPYFARLNAQTPGLIQSRIVTQRKESDTVRILSGVFEGRTLGTPISLYIANENQRSADYEEMREKYRPSHADYTYDAKYGRRDWRGGGRTSARETAAMWEKM